ncbi:MoaD/ThiS family protein [Gaoshiqia sp. Z1-71]|uniref:MoaD/ThiS family protein n=1 Tax=Gaoshiqia hydrogeniformans TaxID=3290090 RepID=UPI003BF7D175
MKTQIQITCFAALRKFFDPEVNIQLQLPAAYHSVIYELKKLNPQAADLLDHCRIAVNERFVAPTDLKMTDEPVYLIPPSSGG